MEKDAKCAEDLTNRFEIPDNLKLITNRYILTFEI